MTHRSIFKRCPKTHKIVGINIKAAWYWIFFPVIGLGALIWFLIRVVPKPSRAAYPCQRAAMPIAFGFLSFLAGITGIGAFCRLIKSKKPLKYAVKGAAAVLMLCFAVYFFVPAAFTGCENTGGGTSGDADIQVATLPDTDNADGSAAAGTEITADEPKTDGADITELAESTEKMAKNDIFSLEKYSLPAKGKGIFPGRVVYAHNPAAVKFEGKGLWWDDKCTIPGEVKKMFIESLCALTGKNNAAEAWEALFRDFNGGEPYKKGEKIVIKLNMNQDGGGGDSMHIPAPQLVEVLVSELIHTAGADGADITLTDPSRSIGSHTYDRFMNHSDPEMKKVRFVAQNHINAVPDKNEPIYFADGQIGYVPTDYTAAKYLINLSLFRVHNAFGITLSGKNHFGSVKFDGDDAFSPINMHGSWENGYGQYSHITDLMAFEHLGQKTLLYIVDGLYTAYHQGDGTVRKMQSFGGEYPSSLFMSQDPCAIDSVAYDFLSVEIGLDDKFESVMTANAPDNYIIEAAYADKPPSNTDYDPNKTGVRVSLGAYEHWNNDTDRKYSRDLGNDYGIELIWLAFD